MSPKNAAEIYINQTKAVTAITRGDRKTVRHSQERREKTGILSNLPSAGALGK
jgi:hypothetical protein